MYDPVAFVDDDLLKVGQEIRGIPVVATSDKIKDLCEKLAIELIIIAIPSADDKQMQRIVSLCEESAVNFRTLPGVQDIVSGRVNINDMREVRIEDLLGRDPVSLEWDEIRQSLTGRTVLVTGGGGSIGSELSRLVAEFEPLQLVIFEQSEFNLYQIDHEISQRHPRLKLITILGDVCDRELVRHIFSSFRPDVVFHAAAYKHVPILQEQLREGVKNNVLGTRNVALAADEYAVERFVFISTDKAVNPGNWMGVTKRVAEVFCQALDAESETSYVIVRFGNVLDSAGSVVPLFRQQLRKGGPITVTHPDVTRYFMTIREASQLILEASSFGQNGEIYVLDMGKPIKISFLAEQMVRLSGKEPGKDIDIVFTGLRPGEKLEEELFYPDEMLTATGYEKIFLANSRKFRWSDVEKSIHSIELHTDNFDEALIAQELHLLVPEIRSEICSVMPAKIPSVA
jgi:FlaA1/EpsC-like NDP-sugar epimerase